MNRKQITVNTNDPSAPRTQLEVVVDLEELLAAAPNRQWYGQIKQDELVTKPFVFEGKLLAEAQISNIRIKEDSPNRDAYSWKIQDSGPGENRTLTMDVTVDAKKIRPGRFNDILLMTTNLEKVPELQLNLSGEVMGPISATPQRLYFGQFEVNKEMEKTISFTSNSGQPFKILNAAIDNKVFKIDPWNRDSAITHTLTIRLLTDAPADRIRTNLIVATDMEAQSEVQVEVHAYQQRTRPENPQVKPDPSSMKSEAPRSTSDLSSFKSTSAEKESTVKNAPHDPKKTDQ